MSKIRASAKGQECEACAQVCEELWYSDPEGSEYARALRKRYAQQK